MDCRLVGRVLLLGMLCGGLATQAVAQQRPLTLDALYDPTNRVNFAGVPPPTLSWMDGTHYVIPRATNDGPDWVSVDAATGTFTVIFSAARLERGLVAAGVQAERARQAARARAIS